MPDNRDTTEVPEFVGNRPRSKTIELLYHVKYRGKVYTSLTVVRMTGQQVTEWADRVQGGDKDALMGNVLDDEGKQVPRELLEALDDDDDFELTKAISDFLPRRLSPPSDSE